MDETRAVGVADAGAAVRRPGPTAGRQWEHHRRGGEPGRLRRDEDGRRRPGGAEGSWLDPDLVRIVWTTVPMASLGFLTPLPFLRNAVVRGGVREWAWFLVHLSLTVTAVTLLFRDWEALAGALLVSTFIAGTLQLVLGFEETARPGPTSRANRNAVRRARARQRRRAAARRLALREPELARELGIGRPSVAGDFDDGGLVDVNHATPAELVHDLGLTPREAHGLVEARESLGGHFGSREELAAYAGLRPRRYEEIADRVLVL